MIRLEDTINCAGIKMVYNDQKLQDMMERLGKLEHHASKGVELSIADIDTKNEIEPIYIDIVSQLSDSADTILEEYIKTLKIDIRTRFASLLLQGKNY